jgi:hypothetical protein
MTPMRSGGRPPPPPARPSLWTVTVDVFSPEPSICGIWASLDAPGRCAIASIVPGLEGQPARSYFDERGGIHAWLAMRVRAHEADGARQRGQDFVDGVLARAPQEVARHRRLRVEVAATSAIQRSWDRDKWLLAPRGADALPRPVGWSHYKLSSDGLRLTIFWPSAHAQPARIATAETVERVRITLYDRGPAVIGHDGCLVVPKTGRRTRRLTVELRKPVGTREVCDGFDGLRKREEPA